MADVIQILTPVGRLVQGDPFRPNTKDQMGNPLVHKNGPNAGQPKVVYFCAIAIPKNDPGLPDLFAKLQAAAQQGFPGGQYNQLNFAWKVTDGDGMDKQGVPQANKEGFRGCYVFRFSSSFAPKCYTAGGASLLTDPESIKRGYYIRIYGTTSGNENMQNPGIYLNLGMVELIGYGQEIKSGPDGAAVFGGAPVGQLPPGASATPLAPATPIAQPPAMGGFPGAQAPAAPAGWPQPGVASAPPAHNLPAHMPPQVFPQPAGLPQHAGVAVPPPAPGGFPIPGNNAAPPPAPAAPNYGVLTPPWSGQR